MANVGTEALKRGRELAVAMSPAKLMNAAARTGSFAAHSMPFATQDPSYPEVPMTRPTWPRMMSVFFEEAMLGAATAGVGEYTDYPAELRRISRDVDGALELFEANGWLEDAASYHQTPPPPDDFTMERSKSIRTRYDRLTFDSCYQPVAGMPGSARWLGMKSNSRCDAYVMEHRGGPRPWVVFLHGHGMGMPIDLSVWGALRYYREMGFNVLAPVLPLHGSRRDKIDFLTLDWVSNVHALTQSVWDVRRCLAWIRQREPSSIAVHGVSLGGYTAALLAGLDGDFSCVVAGVPAATIHRPLVAAAARDAAARRALEEYGLLGDRIETLHRVVTPTSLPCVVPKERLYMYAGTLDRLSPPIEPYELWEYWDRPTIYWNPTSHIFTIMSAKVRQFARQAIVANTQQSPDPTAHDCSQR